MYWHSTSELPSAISVTKHPRGSDLWERSYFNSQLSGREWLGTEARGGWWQCILSHEANLVYPFYLVCHHHEVIAATFRVSLSCSVNSLWKCSHKHSQRHIIVGKMVLCPFFSPFWFCFLFLPLSCMISSIFWILSSYQIHSLQIFSILWVAFLLYGWLLG